MQKIIAALIAAIAFVTGSKGREEQFKAEIATRDTTIADLQKALEDENADDASLEAALAASKEAQAAAEKSLADLLAEKAEADTKADELMTQINADAGIPVEINNGVARATSPGA